LAALSLVLAACGGRHPGKPPLSVRAFRVQANRICVTARSHLDRLTKLRRLHPPAADRDIYFHWLKAESDAVTAVKPLRHEPAKPLFDSRVPVAIAEGKIVGYARRLGATKCA
jgi:hypothetical protein